MLISLLLEQVQQHENEYVVTLIKPSKESQNGIDHSASYKNHGSACSGITHLVWDAVLGTVAHTVTAPDTARRVENLYGITSYPRAGNTWAETVVRCILHFSVITVMLKCGVCFWGNYL